MSRRSRIASVPLFASFLAAFLVLARPAHADTLSYDFTLSGNGVSASGTLTVSTTATPGLDKILSATGVFSSTAAGASGSAITGLSPSAFDPTNPDVDPESVYDDLLFPSGSPGTNACPAAPASLVDYCGAVFLVDGNVSFNLFGNSDGTYSVTDYTTDLGSVYDFETPVAFSITPSALTSTPEPATLSLLCTGLLAIAASRQRRSARR